MSTRTKTLAKSLHTVTALVQVALLLKETRKLSDAEAVAVAVATLGYPVRTADPYDLKGRAVAILTAAK